MTANSISLILLGVLFVIWTGLMFHAIWLISRDARAAHAETGGGYFRWAGHSVSAHVGFLHLPKYQQPRRRVLVVTVLMFAVIIWRAVALAPGVT